MELWREGCCGLFLRARKDWQKWVMIDAGILSDFLEVAGATSGEHMGDGRVVCSVFGTREHM